MARLAAFGLITLGAASLFLLSQPVTAARPPRPDAGCPYDSTVEMDFPDCVGDPAVYELEYTDANGVNDTGEQADEEYEICIAQHDGCANDCALILARKYVPEAPQMQINLIGGYVYWNEYTYEDPEGPQYCTNSCVNDYTDTPDQYMYGVSSWYYYNCP